MRWEELSMTDQCSYETERRGAGRGEEREREERRGGDKEWSCESPLYTKHEPHRSDSHSLIYQTHVIQHKTIKTYTKKVRGENTEIECTIKVRWFEQLLFIEGEGGGRERREREGVGKRRNRESTSLSTKYKQKKRESLQNKETNK